MRSTMDLNNTRLTNRRDTGYEKVPQFYHTHPACKASAAKKADLTAPAPGRFASVLVLCGGVGHGTDLGGAHATALGTRGAVFWSPKW